MYPEQLPLVLDRNDWLYEDIYKGRYESYRRLYYSSTRALKTPNISDRFNSENAIHRAVKNARICAELLRAGAWLAPILELEKGLFLTGRALDNNNWPLVCVIIYARGMAPFEQLKCGAETGIETWDRLYRWKNFTHSVQDGYAWLRTVQYQHNLVVSGKLSLSQNDYAIAFSCFDQAARMLLTFDQGDANLKLFYQEEAAPLFYQALSSLIFELSSGESLSRRGKIPPSLTLIDWKILQKLKLFGYFKQLQTMINLDVVDFAKFDTLYQPHRYRDTPHSEISEDYWQRPEFLPYINLRHAAYARGRTDSNGSSSSSGVCGSNDSLHTA